MKKVDHGSENQQHQLGPFVTWVVELQPHKQTLLLTSRRQRKGLAPLPVAAADIDPNAAVLGIRHHWTRFWGPRRIGWWIGVLFVIGSALFAIGGAKGAWPEENFLRWVDPEDLGWIFFVGSLFFTGAGYLQWLEAINGDVADAGKAGTFRRRWRYRGWRLQNLGYVGATIQLVGMLFFNLNTADAMISGLGWVGEGVIVWTPNMLGSICFLAASHAAIMEVSHRYWSWQFRSLSSWITAINMIGSIFFMISAVASFVEPRDVLLAEWVANFGTFAGALCFLVAGYLLIPEQFELQKESKGSVSIN